MRIPAKRVPRTRLVRTRNFVVAVEVEAVIPEDDGSEPCYESETVQLMRDEFGILPPESNALASAVAGEISGLSEDAMRAILPNSAVQPRDRLNELIAFQSFVDLAHANAGHPGLTRAQE